MKKTIKTMGFLLVLAATLSLIAGCFLFGTTMSARMDLFVSTLNDGGTIATHLHPDCSDYSAAQNSGFIADGSPLGSDNSPFSVSSMSESGSTVTGSFTNANGTFDFSAEMKEDGFMDWKIMSFTLNGSLLIGD